jgi:ACS family glucarate transporter-like MFS transporter/ACS family D-galactonate transporter-like MFS transporter
MGDGNTLPNAEPGNSYASPASLAPVVRPTSVRHAVVALLCIAAIASYLCRNGLAVLDKQVAGDLQLSDAQLSSVMFAFFAFYAILQVPSGWLAHRWGSRATLTLLALGWAVATAAAAGSQSYAMLLVAWAANGAAQTGVFPCCVQSIGKWVPATRRALACGSLTSCMSLGGAAAMYAAGALLAAEMTWREILLVFAIPSAIFAVGFFIYFRDTPDRHSDVNSVELAYIQGPTALDPPPSTLNAPPVPWIALFAHRDLWLICGQQFCRAAAYIFYGTWFPRYLREVYGLSESDAGKWASLPLVAVVAGNLLGGSLVDWLYRRTASARLSRQAIAVTGVGLCGALFAITPGIREPNLAIAVLGTAAFFFGIGSPSSYTITIDKGGPYVTAVFSIMNTAGNIGASLSPVVVAQFVAASDSWRYVPTLLGVVYLAAAVCWLVLDPTGRLISTREASPGDSSHGGQQT